MQASGVINNLVKKKQRHATNQKPNMYTSVFNKKKQIFRLFLVSHFLRGGVFSSSFCYRILRRPYQALVSSIDLDPAATFVLLWHNKHLTPRIGIVLLCITWICWLIFLSFLVEYSEDIKAAFDDISAASCIRFVERTNEAYWIKFVSDNGWDNLKLLCLIHMLAPSPAIANSDACSISCYCQL